MYMHDQTEPINISHGFLFPQLKKLPPFETKLFYMTLNGRNFYNIFCFSLPLDWPPTSAATSVYRLS